MAFLQKTWKDRVAEYINRRVLTKEDGSTELVSVERSEGTISQEGDAFSAANMNDLEQRIANEFSEQNKNLACEKLNVTFDSSYGREGGGNEVYKVGNLIIYVVGSKSLPTTVFGTVATVDLSGIEFTSIMPIFGNVKIDGYSITGTANINSQGEIQGVSQNSGNGCCYGVAVII